MTICYQTLFLLSYIQINSIGWERSVLHHYPFSVLLYGKGSSVPLGQNQKQIFCFVFVFVISKGQPKEHLVWGNEPPIHHQVHTQLNHLTPIGSSQHDTSQWIAFSGSMCRKTTISSTFNHTLLGGKWMIPIKSNPPSFLPIEINQLWKNPDNQYTQESTGLQSWCYISSYQIFHCFVINASQQGSIHFLAQDGCTKACIK